jgi:hypothetical protein
LGRWSASTARRSRRETTSFSWPERKLSSSVGLNSTEVLAPRRESVIFHGSPGFGGDPSLVLPIRRLSDDGLKAWQQVLEHGFEGLVGKDPASPYRGGRTLSWLKIKQRDYRMKERGFYDPGRVLLNTRR